ncbi:MAG TPA: MFS transporter [Streptosporangiaceae bacterium]|nr:MFS transporter [Streptosporangiaceae bacterium]
MNPEATSTSRLRRAGTRWGVVILSFLAVMLDGFDTATLAFVLPTLSEQWGVAPAAFTPAVVLTNLGVVLGYLSCGSLGAWMGRRTMLLLGVTVCGASTLLTAFVLPTHSIALLSVLRLLTGIGFGVILPTAVALTVEYFSARRRELISATVTLGLGSGMTLAGFVGGDLIQWVGTTGVFWVAGVPPLILAAIMVWAYPADPRAVNAAETAKHEAKVGRLFDPELRLNTTLLWTFSFLIFIAAYTLDNWVPTLLLGYGFTAAEAPIGLAYVSLGGVIGCVLLIPLAGRIGIARALILMPTVGVVCMAVASRIQLTDTLLLLVLAAASAGLTGGQLGQLIMAVSLYPPGTRTTGIGWASALGRAGSIVGPGVAGLLLALALPGQDIILLATLPVLVAITCAFVLLRRRAGATGQGEAEEPAEQAVPARPAGQAGQG